MKAEEIMVKKVVTIKPEISIHKAVKLMNKNKIGCLMVLYKKKVIGIITESDMLKKVLEECKNPKKTKVSEIMTQQVIVGNKNMELLEATRLMFEKKIKKLPIIDKSRLVGIVTLTDIARTASVDIKTKKLIDTMANMHMF